MSTCIPGVKLDYDGMGELYISVRFNNGPNTNAGGLEVFDEDSKSWYGVCDTDFDNKAALVACRSIKESFMDARPIPGEE